jgi:hypothetical protein
VSASDVFNVLVLAAVVAYLVIEVRHRRKQKRLFADCAARLGLTEPTLTSSAISGKVRGMLLDVHFVAGSRNTPSHTTIDVAFSPCPVLLHLRPQNADEERSVEQGQAIDLRVGDAAFDAAWIIEGAPAERVTRILADAGLRARLLAFARVERPSVKIEDGKVSLHRGGSEVSADAIDTERMELCLALAEAVMADAATPLSPAEIDPALGAYRTGPSAEGTGAAKIAELKALRATRAIGQLRIATIALGSVLTLMLLGFQLIGDLSPLFPTLPVLLMLILVTVALASAYRNERRSAPGVPHDKLLVGWLVATWVVALALTLRAALLR